MSENYRYKLSSLNESSNRYGNCDVCGKHASEMFIQTEEKEYTRPDGNKGWTQHECHQLFGHKECLENKRR